MRAPLFLISLLLSSAACKQGPQDEPAEPAQAEATASAADEMPEAKAVKFENDASKGGGNREFAYSWPAEVSAIPELAAQLQADLDRDLAEQQAEWEAALAEDFGDCITCISRGYQTEWKVVADLPDWLSLSAELYIYTGGAHGMTGLESLVWDKRNERGFDAAELFVSTVALETALGAKLCDALDRERAKRRGAPVVRDGEWSTDCPGLEDSTVLVGSSNGKTFDRIGIYFGPYTAGAYAEGPYELNFPVTASVLDAVKREYASAFSVKR